MRQRLRHPRAAVGAALVIWLATSACQTERITAAEKEAATANQSPERKPLRYPEARRGDQVDDYHGTRVADPYRWLESMDSDETRRFIRAQDALLRDHLGDDAELARLEARLLAIQHFEAIGVPIPAGDRSVYTRTPPDEMRAEIWLSENGKSDRRLLRPDDHLADDEQISALSVDPKGRRLALTIVDAESNWGELRIFDVDSGRMHEDGIDGLRGGVQWAGDGSGFYYIDYGDLAALRGGREPRPEIRFHRLGHPRDRSILRPAADDNALYGIRLSHDDRFLVIRRFDGESPREDILLYDPARPDSPPRPLIAGIDASFSFEGSDGDRLFFRTDLDAPRYRVIEVDRRRPDRENWQELIPESEHAMTAVSEAGDTLVVQYSAHARPRLSVFGLDGKHRYDARLPKIGWLGGLRDDRRASTIDYSLTTMADPGTVYRLDLASGESTLRSRPELAYDPDAFVIRQVFYPSADGTKVPMFIAHRKDLEPSEDTPLFLYAYGHGGWSAWPWYQPRIVAWLELGGVYALPGARGGGEYGAAWQAAGTAANKENTIADYFAAADWLVSEGYTSYSRLVMNGGSASGVLAGVALARRPDKVGAVMIDFPFLDMLRYHHFTVFPAWIRGYGSSTDAALSPVLEAYSPYHNLEKGRCYPPTLVQVGEVDETTPPLHGYKFVAALQAAQGCAEPVLLKTAWDTKHSAGATRAQRAETWAQEIVFLSRAVGLDTEAIDDET